MSAKPEWEVLADLALRRLEKDYERTLQAKPVVRVQQFKEGDVVSLAGMSTPVLEGAKGIVCGPIDADTLRYPIKLSSPEVPACSPSQHAHIAHALRCDTRSFVRSHPCAGCCARIPQRCEVSAGSTRAELRRRRSRALAAHS